MNSNLQSATEQTSKLATVLANSLGDKKKADEFAVQLYTELKTNPKVLKILENEDAKNQFISDMISVALAGLSPSSKMKHIALTPYSSEKIGDRVEVNIMYQGYVKIARMNGINITAQVVHKGDAFEHDLATFDIKHSKTLSGEPTSAPVCYYAISRDAKTNHITDIEIVSMHDIEKIRAKSKSIEKPNSPWKTFPDEMGKKSAIRRLFKRLGADWTQRISDMDSTFDYVDEVEIVEEEKKANKKITTEQVEKPAVENQVNPFD